MRRPCTRGALENRESHWGWFYPAPYPGIESYFYPTKPTSGGFRSYGGTWKYRQRMPIQDPKLIYPRPIIRVWPPTEGVNPGAGVSRRGLAGVGPEPGFWGRRTLKPANLDTRSHGGTRQAVSRGVAARDTPQGAGPWGTRAAAERSREAPLAGRQTARETAGAVVPSPGIHRPSELTPVAPGTHSQPRPYGRCRHRLGVLNATTAYNARA